MAPKTSGKAAKKVGKAQKNIFKIAIFAKETMDPSLATSDSSPGVRKRIFFT
jgi:hypothetical protein